jgi:hypothetical protein
MMTMIWTWTAISKAAPVHRLVSTVVAWAARAVLPLLPVPVPVPLLALTSGARRHPHRCLPDLAALGTLATATLVLTAMPMALARARLLTLTAALVVAAAHLVAPVCSATTAVQWRQWMAAVAMLPVDGPQTPPSDIQVQ